MKAPKGTVVVSTRRGMLRLQLPRSVCNGRQTYLYLGLPDNPINRQAAEMKAQVIAADIAFDRFDPTLERYRPTATQPDNSPCLGELWEKYTNHKSKILAPSTLKKDFKWIENLIRRLPSQRLQDARQIRKYLLSVLPPKAAKKAWVYLCACCQWAIDDQLVTKNPFQDLARISSGKKSGVINPFSQGERDLIIQGFETNPYYAYYTPFVKFLFLTGCRTSEAIGIQWRHISPDLSTITFSEAVVYGIRKPTKTNKIRKFPINQSLRSLLKAIKPETFDPNALIFPSPHGTVIDGHNFLNRAWKGVLGDLPVQYRSVYHTRHTFISLCLEAGIKVGQVARWVGNSPDTIWRHYAGVINQEEVPEL